MLNPARQSETPTVRVDPSDSTLCIVKNEKEVEVKRLEQGKDLDGDRKRNGRNEVTRGKYNVTAIVLPNRPECMRKAFKSRRKEYIQARYPSNLTSTKRTRKKNQEYLTSSVRPRT